MITLYIIISHYYVILYHKFIASGRMGARPQGRGCFYLLPVAIPARPAFPAAAALVDMLAEFHRQLPGRRFCCIQLGFEFDEQPRRHSNGKPDLADELQQFHRVSPH